jgi:uncharacterized protein (DUF2267 family)
MALDFNKFANEGTQFVKELAKELGYPEDTARAGRVLRSILHALRNQLTTEESVQLLAQFPMFLKAVYVQNWKLHRTDKKAKRLEQFFQEIRALDKQAAQYDFKTDEDIDKALAVVFMALRKHISLGELEDMKAVLPKDLKIIFNNVLMI